MKKKLMILIIFMLALGANTFARQGDGTGPYGGNTRYAYCDGQGYNNNKHFNGRGYGMHSRHSFWNTTDNENLAILLEEKNLEIRKELLKEAPDWEKIEKLSIEIKTEQAKAKTRYMQARYTESQKK
ncbi:hypothetical protein [Fusobacterium sp. PH5-44]|uniref:hypothetical protein n=1 Tax=unclassified Fusobacterium TaxID=2648384 RepID=UPI003D19EE5D